MRGTARELDLPVFQAAQLMVGALRQGRVASVDRHGWYRLRLQPAGQRARVHPVDCHLNGKRTLGEAVHAGLPQRNVRDCLLGELRLGLRFPGSGWMLRDLVWERRHSPVPAPVPWPIEPLAPPLDGPEHGERCSGVLPTVHRL